MVLSPDYMENAHNKLKVILLKGYKREVCYRGLRYNQGILRSYMFLNDN